MHKKKFIHSVNIEDIQHVAEQQLGRKLTKEELRLVQDKLGDYVGWYEAILHAIDELKLNH
ncbi:MAG: hypothetical protein E3K36_08540 [Candidatus Brocadia sp.]|nr:hypothetical protein [Candidatus Brocadia sp.]